MLRFIRQHRALIVVFCVYALIEHFFPYHVKGSVTVGHLFLAVVTATIATLRYILQRTWSPQQPS